MNSTIFGAVIDVEPCTTKSESQELPTAPERALSRTYHSVPQAHDTLELDDIKHSAKLNSPQSSETATASDFQTTRVPNDVEMSRPASPINEQDGVDAMQSFLNPYMNRFRMLTVCLLMFCGGLSDSAPGALIPYIEKNYGIGYAVVSLIFVTNAAGFVSAAFFVDAIRARFGRSISLMIAQTLMICGYTTIVCTPPFPVVIASFFLLGFGLATNVALGNVFAVNLQNGTNMLGAMHGAYGIGGTIGPLIATSMVTSSRLIWSRYYLLPLSVSVLNIAFASWSFWHYEAESGQTRFATIDRTTNPQTRRKNQFSGMAKAFKDKTVVLGALFIFAYQGAEVSISGWIISFLITTRQGKPSSVGYVTSGFWAGITLGRFLLSHPAHKIGEKVFVYGLVIGAAIFELLVWLVPNVFGDAVAVAIVGFLLGPVYPCATAVFSRAIGRAQQVSSLGVISAFGSSGGAVAPFATGILAQAVGTYVLNPIAIGLFAIMLVCWSPLPNARKRTE